ncbi:MAG: hypothetical protein AMJ54_13545 [Deltaproteobacteria bacterium SG8_13]|nr:MAG: hypothetical protein AMJ54_13545 [Deltaproteobacteria bacterium SG8_13]
MHAVLSGPDMKIFGGHLVDNANLLPATAEISIQGILGVKRKPLCDEETGFVLFQFEAGGFESSR